MGNRDDAIKTVGEVARTHQYTLLQDAYHIDDANFDFAWSKDLLQELARQGVKHYVIEMDASQQSVIDDMKNGGIKAKDLIENGAEYKNQNKKDSDNTISNFVDFVKYANDNGIQIHALDDSLAVINQFSNNPEALPLIRSITSGEIAIKDLTPHQQSVLDKIAPNLLGNRVAQDEKLAERIKTATNGERTVVLFGAGHGAVFDGDKQKDLDEHLGGKVGKILLTPNTNSLKKAQEFGRLQELPATIVYTDANPEDKSGKHEIMVWQAKAQAIGAEIKGAEFKDTEYSQLKLPSFLELAFAPKAIPVNEAEVKSR